MSSTSRDVTVVGVSLGAWIAAEIAIKSTARISHLVLANAVGIKIGDRETRDIADIFAITEAQFNELAYFDPKIAARDYKTMADADVRLVARNREATARYGWSPYMHDPEAQGPAAPHPHSDAVPVGHQRPHCLGGLRPRLLRGDPGRALRDDRARRPFSAYRAARRIRPQDLRLHRRTTRNESLSLQRASLSAGLGRSARLSARQPAQPGDRSRRSRPICSIAITTNTCSPTSSAST